MTNRITNIVLFIIGIIILITSVMLEAELPVIVLSALLTGAFFMAIILDYKK